MTDLKALQDLKLKGRKLIEERALVAGRWVSAGEAVTVEDPAEETALGTVPNLPAAEVERAIEAAAGAFGDWSRRTPADRAQVLHRWAALIEREKEGLGALIALENGKPYEEALGEVAYANSFVTWFAGQAERLDGEVIRTSAGHRVLTFKEAVGPVAAITPWNFPAAMITRKVAAAFAAGCTVVLKPASATPFTALALGKLALEAGLPEACFSVVTGDQAVVGGALTGSPLIRKLSFTGSTPVGRKLAQQCAPTLKKLSMELGGAAPLIVFEDADLDVAVEGTIKGKFRNAGQTCVCPNRIYVHAGLRDAYLEKLTARVAALKVAKPFEPGAQIGPLIDRKGLAKVEDHVARTLAAGGRLLTGGERHALGGRFYTPTVLDGGDERLFAVEETFGPVVPVFSFKDEAAVVRLANDSEFGLAAFLFTTDLDRAMHVAAHLEAGIVGVNAGVVSNAATPFGGVKQSGFGREGSIYGLDDYVSVKSVTLA